MRPLFNLEKLKLWKLNFGYAKAIVRRNENCNTTSILRNSQRENESVDSSPYFFTLITIRL